MRQRPAGGETLLTRRAGHRRGTRVRLSTLITLCPWPGCQAGPGAGAIYFPPGCRAGSPLQEAGHLSSRPARQRFSLISCFHQGEAAADANQGFPQGADEVRTLSSWKLPEAWGTFIFTYTYMPSFYPQFTVRPSLHQSAAVGDGRHANLAADIC